jgi:hypothetical protein
VEVVNRVAQSGLITLKLEDLAPKKEILEFDIADYLFKGLILREKDFRAAMDEHDWSTYQDKILCVHCSADAIVPVWAYMLVSIKAEEFASRVISGDAEAARKQLFQEALSSLNIEDYRDQRVVVKGCSDIPVPDSAYLEVAFLLKPVVRSLMYGEPCSTVPLYKKKIKRT